MKRHAIRLNGWLPVKAITITAAITQIAAVAPHPFLCSHSNSRIAAYSWMLIPVTLSIIMILHITVNIDRKGKLRNKLLANKIFIFQFIYYFFPIVFHNPYPLFFSIPPHRSDSLFGPVSQ